MIEVDSVARASSMLAELVRGRVSLSRLALRYGMPRAMLVRALHEHIGAEIAALTVEVTVEAPATPPPQRLPEPIAPRPGVVIRKRLIAPPITGRGLPRTVRVALHDCGVTRTYLVAAYGLAQAADLLQCSEVYLSRYGQRVTDAERELAERVPGQVWVLAPRAPNFIKWAAQPGATWI